MEDYVYEPLLHSDNCARYMILDPHASAEAPITCTLHSASLEDFPRFEAISYAWGEPIKDRQVQCNGKCIAITTNLYHVLRQVRRRDTSRTLWVDSICINQDDSEEQGRQVSIMGQIYKRSYYTLICLGFSHGEHASEAESLVRQVDSMIQSRFDGVDFLWAPCSFPIPDEGEPLVSNFRWASFGVLLQQPWFKRGWVVQEAVLAQHAVVLWAEVEIDWLKLTRVYAWYIFRALGHPRTHEVWLSELHLQAFFIQRKKEASTFRGRGLTEPLNLLGTLDHARSLGVSDPRDRVYAFLNLRGSHVLSLELQPNYTAQYTEVYRDFACEYIRVTASPDILHFIQHNHATLESDLPSWVPRWDVQMYPSSTFTPNYQRYSLSTPGDVQPSLLGANAALLAENATLKVRAEVLDTVSFAGPAFDMHRTTFEDMAALWANVVGRSLNSPYTCSTLAAFLHTLRSARYRGRTREWTTLAASYQRVLQGGAVPVELYEDAKRFHDLRMEHVHNKTFILLSEGHFGLAPCVVEEGDFCCQIKGTKLPFLVRRAAADSKRHYKILGSVVILSGEPDRFGKPKPLEYSRQWMKWGDGAMDIFLC